jgi:hypothetical protein
LSEAVQAALRRWARPSNEQAEEAAREFLALYRELEQDRSLGVSTRQQLRLKVRARLARLAEQIAKRLLLDEPPAKPDPPDKAALPADQPERLAQLAQPGRQAGGPRGGRGAGPPALGGLGAAQGRAGVGWGARGAMSRNFGPPDAGQQLVELIQRTIAPSTWDVNGGPGAIYYWSPGRALVVRQTSDVHGDVADFMDQLHRMGR